MTMTAPIGPERWAATHALMCGEMPAQVRVAAVLGTNETTISRRRAREGWKVLDFSAKSVRPLFDLVRATFWLPILNDPGQAPRLLELFRQFVDMLPETGRDLPPFALAGWEKTDDGSATTEGQSPDGRAEFDLTLDEQIARIGRVLARQLDRLLAAADATGGVLTKQQVEMLNVIMRLAEKFGALASEHAAEKQTRSDDELAIILQRVDARIIHLARGLAGRMAARKADA